MEDYDVRSAASILASVKEQEARFERLTRALEEERRHVSLQLDRSNVPPDRMGGTGPNPPPTSQPLAWQQVVMQVKHADTPPQPSCWSSCLLKPPFIGVFLLHMAPPPCVCVSLCVTHWAEGYVCGHIIIIIIVCLFLPDGWQLIGALAVVLLSSVMSSLQHR
ncbi:hypothetical protein DPEC_G00121730 [Dallia pectoralis]|uniref:Uncharacterized protein n=1 Tax=Dallia pectoralis TaxID=75939 RepID=A0ACC2GQ29_DALPE|nr:hypothetical protein DPEC_G00121730 [Dallia pectoralis]